MTPFVRRAPKLAGRRDEGRLEADDARRQRQTALEGGDLFADALVFEFELGHLELRAEGYHNIWQTAHVGNLKVKGGYGEGNFALFPGAWLAARGEVMRFSTLTDSKGAALPWDNDRNRIEIGLGYRPERTVWLKAAWQRNVEKFTGTNVPNDIQDLLALQMTLGF